MKTFLTLLGCLLVAGHAWAGGDDDNVMKSGARICGNWTNEEHSLIIKISIENGQYRARVAWFADTAGHPMSYWTDQKNPDPALRSRKLLGMSILQNLAYHPSSDSWEDGLVYESMHGKTWNASAYIDKQGKLRVRGYWHLKCIGKTMTFIRVNS